MEQELKILAELFHKPDLQNITRATTRPRLSTSEPLVSLDIVYINTTGFRMQARCCDNTTFSTSFYELDRMVEEREAPDDNVTVEEIKFKVYTDHKALEYFMTTKQLNSRQARWAELLAEYSFIVIYRPGKNNAKVNILSRKEQDLGPSRELKIYLRTRVLLQPDQVDP
jgi:hypothetical protein